MGDFKKFLLLESDEALVNKVENVLTALQYLNKDGKSLGNRKIIEVVEEVTHQIRHILSNGNWDVDDQNVLKVVQKVGVGLAKAADTNEDINGIVVSSISELEELLKKLK